MAVNVNLTQALTLNDFGYVAGFSGHIYLSPGEGLTKLTGCCNALSCLVLEIEGGAFVRSYLWAEGMSTSEIVELAGPLTLQDTPTDTFYALGACPGNLETLRTNLPCKGCCYTREVTFPAGTTSTTLNGLFELSLARRSLFATVQSLRAENTTLAASNATLTAQVASVQATATTCARDLANCVTALSQANVNTVALNAQVADLTTRLDKALSDLAAAVGDEAAVAVKSAISALSGLTTKLKAVPLCDIPLPGSEGCEAQELPALASTKLSGWTPKTLPRLSTAEADCAVADPASVPPRNLSPAKLAMLRLRPLTTPRIRVEGTTESWPLKPGSLTQSSGGADCCNDEQTP
jgi:hypothetical protein